ncbi:hypothetical protein HZH68_009497 [Vespula germanica]|uniref:Uncharacterized protein n=1 Tax=Vespula germanica TaxID=30212 RepID=A0A834N405_VESGE|nr:hypothetical protein HZH68_009497 [Vespula germanica]
MTTGFTLIEDPRRPYAMPVDKILPVAFTERISETDFGPRKVKELSILPVISSTANNPRFEVVGKDDAGGGGGGGGGWMEVGWDSLKGSSKLKLKRG